MAVRALYTGASGMRAMQTRVDVIANNLANVSTTGFKRDRAQFSDLIYQEERRAGVRTPTQNRTPTGINIGGGVRIESVSKDHKQGPLTQTGNQLDMAINGPGYFQVQYGPGQIAYTRDGQFMSDSAGTVLTAEGYPIEPAITLSQDAKRVEITRLGEVISYDAEGNTIGTGQIQLANFINPQGLEAVGDNLYLANEDATGSPQSGNPGTTGFGVTLGRFLEQSNVDVVKEMVDLISAQRAYESNSKAVSASSDMLREVNRLT